MAKTIQRVRGQDKADRKVENQKAFERRLKARLLLFGKGRGKQINLPFRERMFVRSVWQECYQAYLVEFYTGKARSWYAPAGQKWRRMHRDRQEPMSRLKHRRRWFASQKARWIRYDVPNMMSVRFDMETADANS